MQGNIWPSCWGNNGGGTHLFSVLFQINTVCLNFLFIKRKEEKLHTAVFNAHNNSECFVANHQIGIISWELCETGDWSDNANISDFIQRNK